MNSPREKWMVTMILLIVVTFLSFPFFKNISATINNKNTCICSYDGYGYYMYLPSMITDHGFDMTHDWAQKQQNTYCGGTHVYQLYDRENGHSINIYHMGLSVLQAPAFFIGHLVAKFTNHPTDGMSKPYHIAYLINAWIFVLLGILFAFRNMRYFFTAIESAMLTFVLLIGTNFWLTATQSYQLQHHYLFATIAAFLFYLLRYIKTNKGKWIPPILLGLIVLIRPTHILLAFLPMMLLHDKNASFKVWIKKLVPYLICGFIWQIPQLLYWKFIGGSWFLPNLHVEEVILKDPHLFDFIFSFRKGWLLYTPIFLLLPVGFYLFRKHNKSLYKAILFTLLIEIWFMASWECWWYASSFGQRPMVDLYPLLAIPLGFVLFKSGNWMRTSLVTIFVVGCVVLNLFQSEQVERGILSSDRMTRDQYFNIFGKTAFKEDHNLRLLIDRNSLDWIHDRQKYEALNYRFEFPLIYRRSSALIIQPHLQKDLFNYQLFSKLKTDESQLKISLKWKTHTNTTSSEFHLETGNKHNIYGWFNIFLPPTNGTWKDTSYCVNLLDHHHSYDFIKSCVINNSNESIQVKEISIQATSLIRKN